MEKIEIDRINGYEDERFSRRALMQHGAFWVTIHEEESSGGDFFVNRSIPYEVEIISKNAAIIKGNDVRFYDSIIEEFRFYAEHISKFYDVDGKLIKSYDDVNIFKVSLEDIQPSQFYTDTLKKKAVASFVNEDTDVIIPLINYKGRYASLDGHTRMAVAIDKGIKAVYGFLTQTDDYIYAFIEEAKRRNIATPYDIVELPHEEYEEKWNQFCDDFFESSD